MEQKERLILDVSWAALVKVLLFFVGLVIFIKTLDVLLLFLFVFIFVAALTPVVDRLSKEMPRALAVAMLYVLILAIIFLAGYLIIPAVVNQVQAFLLNAPDFLRFNLPNYSQLLESLRGSGQGLTQISTGLSSISANLLSTTIGVLNGFVAVFTLLVVTFYLLIDKKGISGFFLSLVPREKHAQVTAIVQKVGEKLGNWLRGQFLLMLIIGFVDGLVLWIFGIPYPAALGFWAGLTEAIPYIGPWLGAIPGVLIGFTVSPIKGLIALIIYLGVQQIEANFLVPRIMSKAVGLSPVMIILALLVGAKLFGIIGMILAVPVAGAISVIVQQWPEIKKLRQA